MTYKSRKKKEKEIHERSMAYKSKKKKKEIHERPMAYKSKKKNDFSEEL